tara:strand:+ start:806 stop:1357 length:552 start_codon:yes stop_codon:yes gene_type:complete
MAKSFAQIIAPKISGVLTSTKNRQANVQEIISLTFEHAADCGDYSFLSRLANAVGPQERKQIVSYIVEHTENIRWNNKNSAFVKTAKRKSLSFNCAAIAKVTWYEYAKTVNKSLPVNADKKYPVGPSKSHDRDVAKAQSFTGNKNAMIVRRAALAKLVAMSLEEMAAFAGVNTDNVTKLDVAA